MKSFLRTHLYSVLLVSILIIAAGMRFYKCDYSLGNDELSELIRAKEFSLNEIIHHKIYEDIHPAGKLVFTHIWTELFGDSEISLRFPYIIAGVLSLLFIYLLGARWFGKTTGLFAAASLTFLEFPLLYSQIARTYSSGLLFTLMAAYFWTRILFDKGKPKVRNRLLMAAGFTLSVTASMYNHYFSFLFAAIIGGSGLFFLNKKNVIYYLGSGLFIILLFSPHIPVTLKHFGIGGLSSWLGKPEKDAFFYYILYIFNNSLMLAFIFFAILIFTFILFQKQRKTTKFHVLCLLWFLIPFTIIYLYSVYRNPVLQNSGLIFSFPYLILFIFSYLPAKMNGRLILFLVLFLFGGIFHTAGVKKYYRQYHLESFRELAGKMIAYQKKFGNDNITFTTVVNNVKYMDYYFHKTGDHINFAQTYNINGDDLRVLKNILDTCKTAYFVHSQTLPGSDETDALIRTRFHCIIENNTYGQNSFIRLYGREPKLNCLCPEKADTLIRLGFDDGKLYDRDTSYLSKRFISSLPYSIRLDSLKEFGPTFLMELGKISNRKFRMIRLRVKALIPDTNAITLMVTELKSSSRKNNRWSSVTLKNFMNGGTIGEAFLTFYIPKHSTLKDTLFVYMWNPDKKEIWYDDIEMSFYH